MEKIKIINKIANERLCSSARLILRLTVPLVIIQELMLIFYICYSDVYVIFTELHIVHGMAEGVLVSLILSIGGSLLADSLERRKNK